MMYWNKDILVLGCGNNLFGDDGFGPAVIEYLSETHDFPESVGIMDVGLGVREVLFNIMLSESPPGRVIIIDAVDAGREPGEVFNLDIDQIPFNKLDDFSMHQMPTSNLLKELKEQCQVDVRVICVQVRDIPEEVCPGLSQPVQEAIPVACTEILSALVPS